MQTNDNISGGCSQQNQCKYKYKYKYKYKKNTNTQYNEASQVAVPSRTDVREYQELKEMMDKLVGQINGR